jgi:hypothetical protein
MVALLNGYMVECYTLPLADIIKDKETNLAAM